MVQRVLIPHVSFLYAGDELNDQQNATQEELQQKTWMVLQLRKYQIAESPYLGKAQNEDC